MKVAELVKIKNVQPVFRDIILIHQPFYAQKLVYSLAFLVIIVYVFLVNLVISIKIVSVKPIHHVIHVLHAYQAHL